MKRIFCHDGFQDGGGKWQMWHEGYEDHDDFVRARDAFMVAEAARLEAAKPAKPKRRKAAAKKPAKTRKAA